MNAGLLAAKRPCVVPVSAAHALAWAAGTLNDADLLLNAPLVPEAVFIVNLPNLASYRETMRLCQHWRELGAVFMICRTSNDVVDSHMVQKNGSIPTYREKWHETGVKYRYICPPDVFAAWLDVVFRRKAVTHQAA